MLNSCDLPFFALQIVTRWNILHHVIGMINTRATLQPINYEAMAHLSTVTSTTSPGCHTPAGDPASDVVSPNSVKELSPSQPRMFGCDQGLVFNLIPATSAAKHPILALEESSASASCIHVPVTAFQRRPRTESATGLLAL